MRAESVRTCLSRRPCIVVLPSLGVVDQEGRQTTIIPQAPTMANLRAATSKVVLVKRAVCSSVSFPGNTALQQERKPNDRPGAHTPNGQLTSCANFRPTRRGLLSGAMKERYTPGRRDDLMTLPLRVMVTDFCRVMMMRYWNY